MINDILIINLKQQFKFWALVKTKFEFYDKFINTRFKLNIKGMQHFVGSFVKQEASYESRKLNYRISNQR